MLMEIKTAKITSKGQIAIPREIREFEGFKEGKKVAILAFEDHLELRPLAAVRKTLDLTKNSIVTALLSEKSLAKDWDAVEEDEAWKGL